MKQSSIEWFFEQVNILDYRYNGKIISLGEYVNEKNIIELKAKEMHKQEIENAHLHNRCSQDQTYECSIEAIENAENYYKQTFKSE